MIDNYDTIKKYVLILTDLNDSPKIDLQIKAIIDECLAYCYRKDVPPAMELPLSNVIATTLITGIEGNITSYKEGDMSITYSNNGNVKYNGKLEAFKKIVGSTNV